jgi:uncharacterized membrane protein YdjX (TVP38/TMEM64 family)
MLRLSTQETRSVMSPQTMSQTKSLSEAPRQSSRPVWIKIVGALIGIVGLVFLGRSLGGYIPQFAAWVETLGFWGPLVFIAGYAVATIALIPGSLMTLAAGAIFGLLEGTLYTFVGATLGATLAFLVSRYGARKAIERRLENSSKLRAVDRAVAREGRKIVFLLRLSPVFSFVLLNYALGLTSVRFRDYLIASIGMLPGTFLYVYYGKAIGSLAAVAGGAEVERGPGDWILLAVGLLATLLVTTVVTRVARKALEQEVEDD